MSCLTMNCVGSLLKPLRRTFPSRQNPLTIPRTLWTLRTITQFLILACTTLRSRATRLRRLRRFCVSRRPKRAPIWTRLLRRRTWMTCVLVKLRQIRRRTLLSPWSKVLLRRNRRRLTLTWYPLLRWTLDVVPYWRSSIRPPNVPKSRTTPRREVDRVPLLVNRPRNTRMVSRGRIAGTFAVCALAPCTSRSTTLYHMEEWCNEMNIDLYLCPAPWTHSLVVGRRYGGRLALR